jgi:DNA-binding HxlR family transcriptional regulator
MTKLEDLFGRCPYATTQKILSGKWALMLLHILNNGTLRFNEIQRRMPEMTQTTLTRQLRSLEEYGLIERKVYAQIPPKVEYSMTDIGKEFAVVLRSIENFGNKYIEVTVPNS